MASYDRMDWHYGGDYPEQLPEENAGTHIGMFLNWAIDNDLIGDVHRKESHNEIQKVLNREMTGRDFLIEVCDEKFWEDDLNKEGNAFAKFYYDSESTDSFKNYLSDYSEQFEDTGNTIYEVENSWENYEKIKSVINKRYKEWQSKR